MLNPDTVSIVDRAATRRYETLMRRLMLVAVLMLPGCHSAHHEGVIPAGPRITSRVITTGELPPEFDTTRTYHYQLPSLRDPETVVVALLSAGFDVSRAWQPLDDRCLDPQGPTFSVELEVDDPGIQDQGFERGVGRLWCATQLTEYTVSESGS